jgi:hypothetical protein
MDLPWQIAKSTSAVVSPLRILILREPQHERNFLDHFKAAFVRPALVDELRKSLSAACLLGYLASRPDFKVKTSFSFAVFPGSEIF